MATGTGHGSQDVVVADLIGSVHEPGSAFVVLVSVGSVRIGGMARDRCTWTRCGLDAELARDGVGIQVQEDPYDADLKLPDGNRLSAVSTEASTPS